MTFFLKHGTLFRTGIACLLLIVAVATYGLDRKAVVRRHNITTHHIGRQQFFIGVGKAHALVDATATQTFVPDGERAVNIALDMADTTQISNLTTTFDRWTGKVTSRFLHHGHSFHVEAVYAPKEPQEDWLRSSQPMLALRVTSDSVFDVILRPEPTALKGRLQASKVVTLKKNATFQLIDDDGSHWFAVHWHGNSTIKKDKGQLRIRCKGDDIPSEDRGDKLFSLDILLYDLPDRPRDNFYNNTSHPPFTDYALRTATGFSTFWTACGMADFSAVGDPAALLMERHMVEALYNMAIRQHGDWWDRAPLALFGYPKDVAYAIELAAKQDAGQLASRPEFAAVAEMMMQAYAGPETARRHHLSSSDRWRSYSTLIGAYGPYVVQAARLTPDHQWLRASQLSLVGQRWQEAYDSLALSPPTAADRVPPFPFSEGQLFSIPDTAYADDLSDADLLLLIAARRWPRDWPVDADGILPLP